MINFLDAVVYSSLKSRTGFDLDLPGIGDCRATAAFRPSLGREIFVVGFSFDPTRRHSRYKQPRVSGLPFSRITQNNFPKNNILVSQNI